MMGLYITLCTVRTTQGQGMMGLYITHITLCTAHTTQGQEMMGFYITLCTVHTTQGQGTMGFYITLCTVHTTQGQGTMGLYITHITLCTAHTTQEHRKEQEIIVFYCAHPGPCPCPGPGPVQMSNVKLVQPGTQEVTISLTITFLNNSNSYNSNMRFTSGTSPRNTWKPCRASFIYSIVSQLINTRGRLSEVINCTTRKFNIE